jgi:hypothetical protein
LRKILWSPLGAHDPGRLQNSFHSLQVATLSADDRRESARGVSFYEEAKRIASLIPSGDGRGVGVLRKVNLATLSPPVGARGVDFRRGRRSTHLAI